MTSKAGSVCRRSEDKMDTRQLRLFMTLADTLHFSKTSKLMHMSPSTVSRAIQRMEDEVGEPLFERDCRQVRLTATGHKFQEFARDSLSNWQSFNDDLHEEAARLRGEIAVFCSVTAVYGVLAKILGPFRHRYPEIDIKLHTGDQADAIDHLLNGEEDLVITARPDSLPATLDFLTLTRSPLQFIYPIAEGEVGDAVRTAIEFGKEPDWSAIPFIMSERGQARVQLDQWFTRQRIRTKYYAQVSGHEAIVSMVALGFGVGVVPELVLSFSPLRDKVGVVDVQPALVPFSVGLCARSEQLRSPLVRALWSCAESAFVDNKQ
jgi:LysR family positive regulator for ilvC